MPTPPLQTYRRRSRAYTRHRRDTRAIAIAVGIAVFLLAAAGVAWGVHAASNRPDRGQAGRATAGSTSTSETTGAGSAPATGSPRPTTTPAEKPASRPATISVAAVGDMLFDRNVKALVNARGGAAPLAHVAAHLSAADVTVGNLETTLAKGGARNPVKEPKYAFRGHPDGIKALSSAGFDAVSLANNHMLDYGPTALAETVAALDGAGIAHSGAGANQAAAWKPASIELADGTRVAYLAFTHIVPPGFLAGEERAGVASGKMDMAMITDAIKTAKKDHDYVLVSFHWGVEYQDAANGDQVKKAHQAIDAGADMVLAHHPHVIQGVEYYKDRLIAYSLGDFVFDHYSRKTGESFVLDAQLGPDGVTDAIATPVYLDGYGAPAFVTGSEARTILTRLKSISSPLGATVTLDGSKARITP